MKMLSNLILGIMFYFFVCLLWQYNATQLVVNVFSLNFTGLPEFPAACRTFMSLTLECVCPNGKICVDLFIKAHLGMFKVKERNSRNALRCCSGVNMWLPEGNISPLHTSIYRGWALVCNGRPTWYDAQKWLIKFTAVIHSSAAFIFY